MLQASHPSWWQRRSLPVRIGLGFAAAGFVLAVIGILRGQVPLNPLSILMALAISAGGWFLVSWAIATAAVDVERDLEETEPSDS